MSLNVFLLIVHVCLALGIITLILLQRGKGASEGATFGGGGASTVFGASGSSNFLSKTTAILATFFFINSLALAYLVANRDQPNSVVDTIQENVETIEIPADTLDSEIPMPVEAEESDIPPAE